MERLQFGTGGFRGVVGSNYTRENVYRISQGIASVILANHHESFPVIIGYDNRFLSKESADWIAEVLNGNGIRVFVYSHSCPTPMVMLATQQNKNKYGIMITASHNPYYFNGIKLVKEGGYDADVELTNMVESKIPDSISDIKFMCKDKAIKNNLYSYFVNDIEYGENLKKFLLKTSKPNLKALFNNLNGTAVVSLKNAADILGVGQFDTMNEEADPFFGFRLPNPIKDSLKGEFIERVVNEKYDLGLAADSDGDRLAVIDELGNYVSANEVLACIYYYLIKVRGLDGDVVKNIATSNFVDMVAEKLGKKCYITDVGFKNITSKMLETNSLLGGESSGGLTMRNYINGKDSTFSASLFLEMMSYFKKPLSQIVRSIKDFSGYSSCFLEDFITLKKDKKVVFDSICNDVPSFSRAVENYQVLGCNFKFFFSDGWVLLRLSGTEPALRIFAEFKDRDIADTLISELRTYITNLQEKL